MGRLLNLQQEAELASLYLQGEKMTVLQGRFQCSEQTIHRTLDRLGVPSRKVGRTEATFTLQEQENAKESFEQTRNVDEVAILLGVARQTATKLLDKLGIDWRKSRYKPHYVKGYRIVYIDPSHPFHSMSSGYHRVAEHRLRMAEHLGRPLYPYETVHHKNGQRADNRIENLQLRLGRHGTGVQMQCRKCGSIDIEAKDI